MLLDGDYLKDTFEMCSDDISLFTDLCEAMDRHTSYIRLNLKDLYLISIKDMSLEELELTHELIAYRIDPDDRINGGDLNARTITINTLPYENEGLASLIEEARTTNQTLVADTGSHSLFFLSNAAFLTLAQRIDCDAKTLSHRGIERDLFIGKQLNRDMPVTAVIRQYRQVGKIFALTSSRYGDLPISVLSLISDFLSTEQTLGKPTCMGWKVNHAVSEIRFRFDEYADEISNIYGLPEKMVPTVYLKTSGIGQSSVTAYGGWLTKHGEYVPDTEYSREHRGGITMAKVLEECKRTIFEKFTILPERLADLMSIPVTPGQCDLTTSDGKRINRETVMQMLRQVMSEIKLRELIGPMRFKQLMECIDFGLINESKAYCVYDIVMMCFSLPDQLKAYLVSEGLGESIYQKMQASFSRVPYLDFGKVSKTEEKVGEVFLTPAV